MGRCFFVFLFLFSIVNSASIKVLNEPKYFANGFNNIIEILIDEDIIETRVFFKDSRSPRYQLYTKMDCEFEKCYSKLPLTTKELLYFDYIIAYKDKEGKLYKTKQFSIIKRDILILPSWQNKYKNKKVLVYTELKKPPKYVRGFSRELDIKPTLFGDIWGVKLDFYNNVNNSTFDSLSNCKENNSNIFNIKKEDFLDKVKF